MLDCLLKPSLDSSTCWSMGLQWPYVLLCEVLCNFVKKKKYTVNTGYSYLLSSNLFPPSSLIPPPPNFISSLLLSAFSWDVLLVTTIQPVPTDHRSGWVEGHIQIACLLQWGSWHWTQATLTSPILKHLLLKPVPSHSITCCSLLKRNWGNGEEFVFGQPAKQKLSRSTRWDSGIIIKGKKGEVSWVVRLNTRGDWQVFADDSYFSA